jgi:hypothetical protein
MDTNRSEKLLTRIIIIILNAAKHLHSPLAYVLTYYRHASHRQGAGYPVSHIPFRVSINTSSILHTLPRVY